MDDELERWQALYQSQGVDPMTLMMELERLRRRDRWRWGNEAVAMVVVAVGSVFYILTMGLTGRIVGSLLLALTAVMGLWTLREWQKVREAQFAEPRDYLDELVRRHEREVRRLSQTWVLWSVLAVVLISDAVIIGLNLDAYRAHPEVLVISLLVEAAIFAGVVWWRRAELRRLAEEGRAIERWMRDES